MYYDDLEEAREMIMLQGDYCTCGTPDPLDHLDTCMVYIDILALLEVEAICTDPIAPSRAGTSKVLRCGFKSH